MPRWISIALGAAVIGLASYVTFRGFAPPKPLTPSQGDAGASAIVDAGAVQDAALAMSPESDGGPVLLSDLIDTDMRTDSGFGGRMPDGTPVPPLPEGTPKEVRFGVVLVVYSGAQGAPVTARPRALAKELADKLAGDAKGDFKAAVQRGDPGSSEDVGRIRRGYLEPAVEFGLFMLPVGGVSTPIETPRGYWIAKRIE